MARYHLRRSAKGRSGREADISAEELAELRAIDREARSALERIEGANADSGPSSINKRKDSDN